MGLYSDNTLLVRQFYYSEIHDFHDLYYYVLQSFNLLLSLILLPSLAVFLDGSSYIPPPLFPLPLSLFLSLSASLSLPLLLLLPLPLPLSLSLTMYHFFSLYPSPFFPNLRSPR